MSKLSVAIILIMINLISTFLSIADTLTQPDTVRAVDIVDDIPSVDGLLNDTCWDKALRQSIDQVWINYGEKIDSSDYSGWYKVLWSSYTNLLYFIVEINDDVFVDGYQYDNDGYYNYDIVEVFIDQDKSGGLHVFDGIGSVGQEWGTNAENAFSYHINADLLPNSEPNFNFTVCDISGTDWGNKKFVNYADHFPQFALQKSDGKYYWEFSLSVYDSTYDQNDPSASLVTLQTGDVLGLSLAYCDNDDPNEEPKERDNFFGSVWIPEERVNDHWKNANNFGTLKLVNIKNITNTSMTIGTNFWDQAWGGSDPWKNGYQYAISPDSVNNPAYNPWKPEFVNEINFYSTLRFMDFARINNNHDEIFWSDRVKKENINQERMALEWMIDLCNRTNTDMWICLPELTVEDYWDNAAKLIKQQLSPNLKVYIEWSNETWNPQFSANQTAIDRGKAYDLWFPNDKGTSWGERRLAARYSTFKSIRIWEKFVEVFDAESNSRIVKVFAGSAADNWWDAALINALTDSTINPNNTLPDMFAIAPYVGAEFNGADQDILEKMKKGISSAEKEIINVRSVLKGTNQFSEQMPPHPAVSTLDLACYEGGQHILHQSDSFAVNPGAYDWYTNYLDMLSKYISGPYINYNHSGNWGDMAWGAKNNIGQPAVESPKFMALHNWYIIHNKRIPE